MSSDILYKFSSNEPSSLEIIYQIKELLIDINSLKDDYNCQNCKEFIYKKVPLQCVNGCWFCEGCWKKIYLESNKKCTQCNCEIKSIDELSRNKFLEKAFGRKLVCCPHSFKLNESPDLNNNSNNSNNSTDNELIKDEEFGCDEIITVDQLDNHIKECKFKFDYCKFKGCNQILRLNQLESHHDICDFKLVKCNYNCKNEPIISCKLDEHYSICPMKPISCDQCNEIFERKIIENHKSTTCPQTIILCKYSDVGCLHNMKRCELDSHIELINHSSFIEKKFNFQTELISKLLKIIDENNKKHSDELTKFKNQTKNELLQYENKWVISNYLKAIENSAISVSYDSPKFKVNGNEFYISIYHKGYNKESSKDNLSIILYLNEPQKEITVSYKISLINHKDSKLNIDISGKEKKFNTSGWGSFQVVKSDQISKSNGWLNDNGELILDINVEIIKTKIAYLKSQ